MGSDPAPRLSVFAPGLQENLSRYCNSRTYLMYLPDGNDLHSSLSLKWTCGSAGPGCSLGELLQTADPLFLPVVCFQSY